MLLKATEAEIEAEENLGLLLVGINLLVFVVLGGGLCVAVSGAARDVQAERQAAREAEERELAHKEKQKEESAMYREHLRMLMQKELVDDSEKDRLIEKYQLEIRQRNDEIEKKMYKVDSVYGKYEKLVESHEAAGGATVVSFSEVIRGSDDGGNGGDDVGLVGGSNAGGNGGTDFMMEHAIRMLEKQGHSGERARIMMVGDRFDTDIRGGRLAGVMTCLVETGAHTYERQSDYPDDVRHP